MIGRFLEAKLELGTWNVLCSWFFILCDGAVLVLRAVLFAVAFLAFGGTFSTPHIAPIFTKVSDDG